MYKIKIIPHFNVSIFVFMDIILIMLQAFPQAKELHISIKHEYSMALHVFYKHSLLIVIQVIYHLLDL